jgi:hypothetical protein
MGGVGVELHFLLASSLRGRCAAKDRAPGIHWVDPKASLDYSDIRTAHFVCLDKKLKI